MNVPSLISEIRNRTSVSQQELAQTVGTSLVSINKWERGSGKPSPAQLQKLLTLHASVGQGNSFAWKRADNVFASRGVRRKSYANTLFDYLVPKVNLSKEPHPPILERLTDGDFFSTRGRDLLQVFLKDHSEAARTATSPPESGMSAGKNTYTYDAHTYHTKVPPQGIAELVAHYLPDGGLVLDPFAGSGMTGVACNVIGFACILNELSPAACFISERFTSSISPDLFEAGVTTVLDELDELRRTLYTTRCRECSEPTEILYTVWSYNAICNHCGHEFLVWDHCRKYGENVREHKILGTFPCPNCKKTVKKSTLQRTTAQPVMVVYKCCQKDYKHHSLNKDDLKLVKQIEQAPPIAKGFIPCVELPDGVNLRQPKKHGLDRVDKFYTPRNLAAMSQLWRTIHRVDELDVAGFLAFAFTSLYQRVTRLSEFRFWGGSGNMARFNVPFIFKEANVFDTFARKARTIQDHLQATAAKYQGQSVVIRHSATSLYYLPDESVDLIFTDPPFGANINYSEMNLLWESWLGDFTDSTDEAIMNKCQGKGVNEYQELMTASLSECYRVLRSGHWMLLVFMNSSKRVLIALRNAISDAGFVVERIDIFDKQHATFKQFVSDNTPGADLILHCQKPLVPNSPQNRSENPVASARESLLDFLNTVNPQRYRTEYLHVNRETEFDFRTLYSEWLSQRMTGAATLIDYAEFRSVVSEWLTTCNLDESLQTK